MEAELVHLNRDGRIELWARRVGECKSSGLTVRKWCEQQHINEKTYFRWQKMIADKVDAQQSAGFVEVPPQPSASWALQKTTIAVLHGNGLSIEVYAGATAGEIDALCRGLSRC